MGAAVAAPAAAGAVGGAGGGGAAAGGGATGGGAAGGGGGGGGWQNLPGGQGGGGGGDDEQEEEQGKGGGGGGLFTVLVAASVVGSLSFIVVLVAMFAMLSGPRTGCAPSGVEGGGTDEADLEAMEIAVRIFEVAQQMRLSDRYVLAAYATVMVEAGGQRTLRNPMCRGEQHCDRDSVGAFQQRNFSPWTDHGRNRRNVRDAARTFFEQALKKDGPGVSIGALADRVQVSAFPERYSLPHVTAGANRFLASVRALSPQQFAALSRGGLPPSSDTQFVEDRRAGGTAPRQGFGEAGPVMPVKGTLTSPFGPRWGKFHYGLDFAAPIGTPVVGVLAGTVAVRTVMSGYGNIVCVRHRPDLTTCYAHLSRFEVRRIGQTVRRGEIIAYVGNTGRSTGPHLHFEVHRASSWKARSQTDPKPFLASAPSVDGTAPSFASGGCGAPAPQEGETLAELPEGRLEWPATVRGRFIGGSNKRGSTHDPATWPYGWQSDNAIDIGLPVGTPIVAIADGEVCRRCGFGPLSSRHPQLAGLRLTLDIAGNQVYYTHLSRIVVKRGQRLRRGEVIGYSGTANGVPHLHIAVRNGRPEALLGLEPRSPREELA